MKDMQELGAQFGDFVSEKLGLKKGDEEGVANELPPLELIRQQEIVNQTNNVMQTMNTTVLDITEDNGALVYGAKAGNVIYGVVTESSKAGFNMGIVKTGMMKNRLNEVERELGGDVSNYMDYKPAVQVHKDIEAAKEKTREKADKYTMEEYSDFVAAARSANTRRDEVLDGIESAPLRFGASLVGGVIENTADIVELTKMVSVNAVTGGIGGAYGFVTDMAIGAWDNYMTANTESQILYERDATQEERIMRAGVGMAAQLGMSATSKMVGKAVEGWKLHKNNMAEEANIRRSEALSSLDPNAKVDIEPEVEINVDPIDILKQQTDAAYGVEGMTDSLAKNSKLENGGTVTVDIEGFNAVFDSVDNNFYTMKTNYNNVDIEVSIPKNIETNPHMTSLEVQNLQASKSNITYTTTSRDGTIETKPMVGFAKRDAYMYATTTQPKLKAVIGTVIPKAEAIGREFEAKFNEMTEREIINRSLTPGQKMDKLNPNIKGSIELGLRHIMTDPLNTSYKATKSEMVYKVGQAIGGEPIGRFVHTSNKAGALSTAFVTGDSNGISSATYDTFNKSMMRTQGILLANRAKADVIDSLLLENKYANIVEVSPDGETKFKQNTGTVLDNGEVGLVELYINRNNAGVNVGNEYGRLGLTEPGDVVALVNGFADVDRLNAAAIDEVIDKTVANETKLSTRNLLEEVGILKRNEDGAMIATKESLLEGFIELENRLATSSDKTLIETAMKVLYDKDGSPFKIKDAEGNVTSGMSIKDLIVNNYKDDAVSVRDIQKLNQPMQKHIQESIVRKLKSVTEKANDGFIKDLVDDVKVTEKVSKALDRIQNVLKDLDVKDLDEKIGSKQFQNDLATLRELNEVYKFVDSDVLDLLDPKNYVDKEVYIKDSLEKGKLELEESATATKQHINDTIEKTKADMENQMAELESNKVAQLESAKAEANSKIEEAKQKRAEYEEYQKKSAEAKKANKEFEKYEKQYNAYKEEVEMVEHINAEKQAKYEADLEAYNTRKAEWEQAESTRVESENIKANEDFEKAVENRKVQIEAEYNRRYQEWSDEKANYVDNSEAQTQYKKDLHEYNKKINDEYKESEKQYKRESVEYETQAAENKIIADRNLEEQRIYDETLGNLNRQIEKVGDLTELQETINKYPQLYDDLPDYVKDVVEKPIVPEVEAPQAKTKKSILAERDVAIEKYKKDVLKHIEENPNLLEEDLYDIGGDVNYIGDSSIFELEEDFDPRILKKGTKYSKEIAKYFFDIYKEKEGHPTWGRGQFYDKGTKVKVAQIEDWFYAYVSAKKIEMSDVKDALNGDNILVMENLTPFLNPNNFKDFNSKIDKEVKRLTQEFENLEKSLASTPTTPKLSDMEELMIAAKLEPEVAKAKELSRLNKLRDEMEEPKYEPLKDIKKPIQPNREEIIAKYADSRPVAPEKVDFDKPEPTMKDVEDLIPEPTRIEAENIKPFAESEPLAPVMDEVKRVEPTKPKGIGFGKDNFEELKSTGVTTFETDLDISDLEGVDRVIHVPGGGRDAEWGVVKNPDGSDSDVLMTEISWKDPNTGEPVSKKIFGKTPQELYDQVDEINAAVKDELTNVGIKAYHTIEIDENGKYKHYVSRNYDRRTDNYSIDVVGDVITYIKKKDLMKTENLEPMQKPAGVKKTTAEANKIRIEKEKEIKLNHEKNVSDLKATSTSTQLAYKEVQENIDAFVKDINKQKDLVAWLNSDVSLARLEGLDSMAKSLPDGELKLETQKVLDAIYQMADLKNSKLVDRKLANEYLSKALQEVQEKSKTVNKDMIAQKRADIAELKELYRTMLKDMRKAKKANPFKIYDEVDIEGYRAKFNELNSRIGGLFKDEKEFLPFRMIDTHKEILANTQKSVDEGVIGKIDAKAKPKRLSADNAQMARLGVVINKVRHLADRAWYEFASDLEGKLMKGQNLDDKYWNIRDIVGDIENITDVEEGTAARVINPKYLERFTKLYDVAKDLFGQVKEGDDYRDLTLDEFSVLYFKYLGDLNQTKNVIGKWDGKKLNMGDLKPYFRDTESMVKFLTLEDLDLQRIGYVKSNNDLLGYFMGGMAKNMAEYQTLGTTLGRFNSIMELQSKNAKNTFKEALGVAGSDSVKEVHSNVLDMAIEDLKIFDNKDPYVASNILNRSAWRESLNSLTSLLMQSILMMKGITENFLNPVMQAKRRSEMWGGDVTTGSILVDSMKASYAARGGYAKHFSRFGVEMFNVAAAIIQPLIQIDKFNSQYIANPEFNKIKSGHKYVNAMLSKLQDADMFQRHMDMAKFTANNGRGIEGLGGRLKNAWNELAFSMQKTPDLMKSLMAGEFAYKDMEKIRDLSGLDSLKDSQMHIKNLLFEYGIRSEDDLIKLQTFLHKYTDEDGAIDLDFFDINALKEILDVEDMADMNSAYGIFSSMFSHMDNYRDASTFDPASHSYVHLMGSFLKNTVLDLGRHELREALYTLDDNGIYQNRISNAWGKGSSTGGRLSNVVKTSVAGGINLAGYLSLLGTFGTTGLIVQELVTRPLKTKETSAKLMGEYYESLEAVDWDNDGPELAEYVMGGLLFSIKQGAKQYPALVFGSGGNFASDAAANIYRIAAGAIGDWEIKNPQVKALLSAFALDPDSIRFKANNGKYGDFRDSVLYNIAAMFGTRGFSGWVDAVMSLSETAAEEESRTGKALSSVQYKFRNSPNAKAEATDFFKKLGKSIEETVGYENTINATIGEAFVKTAQKAGLMTDEEVQEHLNVVAQIEDVDSKVEKLPEPVKEVAKGVPEFMGVESASDKANAQKHIIAAVSEGQDRKTVINNATGNKFTEYGIYQSKDPSRLTGIRADMYKDMQKDFNITDKDELLRIICVANNPKEAYGMIRDKFEVKGAALPKIEKDELALSAGNFTLSMEGGAYIKNNVEESTWGVTKEVARKHGWYKDMKDLPKEFALEVYKKSYFEPAAKLSNNPQVVTILADAAYNHGLEFAKKIHREIGDNPQALIEARAKEYNRLVTQNPNKYARYEKGWMNRLAALEKHLDSIGGGDSRLAGTSSNATEGMNMVGTGEQSPMQPQMEDIAMNSLENQAPEVEDVQLEEPQYGEGSSGATAEYTGEETKEGIIQEEEAKPTTEATEDMKEKVEVPAQEVEIPQVESERPNLVKDKTQGEHRDDMEKKLIGLLTNKNILPANLDIDEKESLKGISLMDFAPGELPREAGAGEPEQIHDKFNASMPRNMNFSLELNPDELGLLIDAPVEPKKAKEINKFLAEGTLGQAVEKLKTIKAVAGAKVASIRSGLDFAKEMYSKIVSNTEATPETREMANDVSQEMAKTIIAKLEKGEITPKEVKEAETKGLKLGLGFVMDIRNKIVEADSESVKVALDNVDVARSISEFVINNTSNKKVGLKEGFDFATKMYTQIVENTTREVEPAQVVDESLALAQQAMKMADKLNMPKGVEKLQEAFANVMASASNVNSGSIVQAAQALEPKRVEDLVKAPQEAEAIMTPEVATDSPLGLLSLGTSKETEETSQFSFENIEEVANEPDLAGYASLDEKYLADRQSFFTDSRTTLEDYKKLKSEGKPAGEEMFKRTRETAFSVLHEDVAKAILKQHKLHPSVELAIKELDNYDTKSGEKRVGDYLKVAGLKGAPNTTSWCAAFISYVAKEAGMDVRPTAGALKFAELNKNKVKLEEAQSGDVLIFRNSPTTYNGHVNMVAYNDGKYIIAIGGNQTDPSQPYEIGVINFKVYEIEEVNKYRDVRVRRLAKK